MGHPHFANSRPDKVYVVCGIFYVTLFETLVNSFSEVCDFSEF